MKKLLLTVTTGLVLGMGAAWAGPLEDGTTAYQRGSYAEALRWFRLATAQGNASGQYFLGVMYRDGQGVAQDYAEALRWFRLAAAQADTAAESNLASMYQHGQGVTVNYPEAVRLYRLAAAQGNPGAQNNLGWMYFMGQGVAQDYVRAHMWFNLVSTSGWDPAVKSRDIVAARMTPQQIADAQVLARECQQRNFKDCD